MCLLFISTNPEPAPDGYVFVLANVRDEFFHRPTKHAGFFDDMGLPSAIGGIDLDKGGTWLAMNKKGKVATLLNILQPKEEICPDKKSRGYMVVDFLRDSTDVPTYLSSIKEKSDEYNGFLLWTADVRVSEGKIVSGVYSNIFGGPTLTPPGVFAYSNSKNAMAPWPKACAGKAKFAEIVSQYAGANEKEKLIEEIFGMLNDTTRYPVSTEMTSQGSGYSQSVVEGLSSIYVRIPEMNYGSRSHTIILIDDKGNATYVEKALKEPITFGKDETWITNRYEFRIG